MKKIVSIALAFLFSGIVQKAVAAEPDGTSVREFTLSNGLQVWLNEDRSQPLIFGMVVVKAGAKDSPNTGIPHYFEHIMFKGTDKIGTTDYAAEKILLDSIRMQYDLLKVTRDEDERYQIQKKINEISGRAAEYVVSNEFDNLISYFGGTELNAGTGYDETTYQNKFTSDYLEPWLEINSERLLNPVFRMFQTELETVYEEKNMYSDIFFMAALDKVIEIVMRPHPYSTPIIGTTENLKNPDMAAMDEFYRKYYVGGNMGLMLSGDFDTEEILPLLEKYFGRIPAGTVQHTVNPQPAAFNGREEHRIKIPIPIIKLAANVWRTVPVNHPDEPALKVAMNILSNDNDMGFLDELSRNRKVLFAAAFDMNMNEAGVAAAAYGKIFGIKKAEKRVLAEIERLKQGDFTAAQLESAKLDISKEHMLFMENMDSRIYMMNSVFGSGQTWDEYNERMARIAELTSEDIVSVANKYLGRDMMVLRKKTGKYPKDEVTQPGFDPVIPQSEIKESEYSASLKERFSFEVSPRFITDEDITVVDLAGGDKLFASYNPYNEIFLLTKSYEIGYNNDPALRYLPDYLYTADSRELTNAEFNEKMRELGATISYRCTADRFEVKIQGFDDKIGHTLEVAEKFLSGIVKTKNADKNTLDAKKVADRTLVNDNYSISDALYRYVIYGDNSLYLNDLTNKELKKNALPRMPDYMDSVRRTRTMTRYSGKLSPETVAELITRAESEVDGKIIYPYVSYDSPSIFAVDMRGSRQSALDYVIYVDDVDSPRDRALATVFNMYMGGSMNSVLFREIREYRSFAYSAGSNVVLPNKLRSDRTAVFRCYLTTQTDKTVEALAVLDSLVRTMTFDEEQFRLTKISVANNINNGFPDFRTIGSVVDRYMEQGYTHDPNMDIYAEIENLTLADLQKFYDDRIRNNVAVVALTTDLRKVPVHELKLFGNYKEVTVREIVKM